MADEPLDLGTLVLGLENLGTTLDEARGPNAATLSGQELPGTSNVMASPGLAYVTDSERDVGVDILHAGSQEETVVGDDAIASYTTVNLRAGYDFTVGATDLRVDAFVENVFDEFIVLGRATEGGITRQSVDEPRTFGVAVTARF